MEHIVEGKKGGPLLVCIHGLMGGPEDYISYKKRWGEHCEVVLLDMDVKARQLGWAHQEAAAAALNYSGKGDRLAAFMKEKYPGRKAYYVGVSMGGKIIYDIAGKYPEIFAGGVVTDTGLGSLSDSEFSKEMKKGLYQINLFQPWKELKKEIAALFPDRKSRILISTQIHYPHGPDQPARWKGGLGIINDMLQDGDMEDQWELAKKFEADSKIIVLKSLNRSGISTKDYERMIKMKRFDFMEIPASNHFFHISSHQYVSDAVMYMTGNAPRPKLGRKKQFIKLPHVWHMVRETRRIQRAMRTQIREHFKLDRLDQMHPKVLQGLVRRFDRRAVKQVDVKVFMELKKDPEVFNMFRPRVRRLIQEKIDRYENPEVYKNRPLIDPRFATMLVLMFVIAFLIVYDAQGAKEKQTIKPVTTLEPKKKATKVKSAKDLKNHERAKEIAKKIENFHLGFKGEETDVEMILINAQGKEVVRKMKGRTYEGGDKSFKSIMSFKWPADIKGTKVLTWNNSSDSNGQWVYLPSTKRVKRISSRNIKASFMGSEFTFEDLGGHGSKEYDYQLLNEHGKDSKGNDVWVLELYPKHKNSGYSKIKTWVQKKIYSPSRTEYYDRKGKLLKVSEYTGYKQFKKWWRTTEIVLSNVQTKKKTIMRWNKRELGKTFNENEFNPRALRF